MNKDKLASPSLGGIRSSAPETEVEERKISALPNNKSLKNLQT